MSEAKFTKGPWCLEKQLGTGDTDCGWGVLEQRAVDEYDYRGPVCRITDSEHIEGITIPERDANARLIAAAPELYEALTFFVTHPGVWQLCSPDSRAMQAARAALSKALGDSK